MTSELGFLGSTHCRREGIRAAADGGATERKAELGLAVTPPHFVRGLLGLVILRMGSMEACDSHGWDETVHGSQPKLL